MTEHVPTPDGSSAGRRQTSVPPRAGRQRRPGVAGLHPREVADAIWLAVNHPDLAGPEPMADDDPRTGAPTSPAAHWTPPPGAIVAPDRKPEGQEQSNGSPEDDPTAASPHSPVELTSPARVQSAADDALITSAAAPGDTGRRGIRQALARPAVAVTVSGVPGRAALGRALRPLRRTVSTMRNPRLDEEATAERLSANPELPPVMGMGPEARWDALLAVDSGMSMFVWQEVVARLAAALRRYGGFRRVVQRRLVTDSSAPEGIVLRGFGSAHIEDPPKSLVDPSGRQIVFVVTNGLSSGWRCGAAQSSLRSWAQHQPLVILHTLDQQLWHRTGLHPQRVRLYSSGPHVANGQVTWELADRPRHDVRERRNLRRVLPVPVLEISEDWIGPWARFIAGEGPRWVEIAAVLTRPWHRTGPDVPAPSPKQRAPSAAERVTRFRSWASPEAFALATRLAAVQLDLPVILEVQRHTLPGSRPGHLAQFFMGDLVEPLPGDEESFLFHEGVREELLALSSRKTTEIAARKSAEILAEKNSAARELLAHFAGESISSEPLVTPENFRFRMVESSVLRALSGQHLKRAKCIEESIDAHSISDVSIRTSARAARETAHSDLGSEGSGKVNSPERPDGWSAHKNEPARAAQESVGGSTVSQGEVTVTGMTRVQGPEEARTLLDGQGRRSSARPVIAGNTPPRNRVFTGREELLRELERGLREGPTAVLPHALHGMGGVGKSQLALEFVYRHASEYEIVWWIPAERPTQIAQAFVELARRLDLPVSGEANTAVPAVLEALRTGNPYAKWLLVFDNAESPQAVQEYFPTMPGPNQGGSILVTSRNPQWNTLAHPLEVDVFERSESIHLLQRRNKDLSTEDANKLAEVLGDLPLAVEQASAWRAETGMPADEYLRLFDEKRAELMTVSQPTQYEETVATAWNVSLDHLERKNAAALQLLQVCAFFAPEPISRSFFSGASVDPIAPDLDLALSDPLRLGRAIREINRYSLAKIDHRTNSIQMHRLVQAVLVARMSEEQRDRMRHGAHLLLAANTPGDAQDPQHWTRFADLYPHVLVSEATASANRQVRQMVCGITEFLFFWGDHGGAREFGQQAYDLWKGLYGEGDRQTLMLGRHLRFALWTLGRYQESAALNERMLAVLRQPDADAEEELLRAMGQVGIDRRAVGDFRGALVNDEEVYERAVRSFGEDDPETLLHAHNLGVSLRVNGHFRNALELDNQTWQRKAQIYGADALITLLTEASIALNRREMGEYSETAQHCEAIVDKYRRLFGDTSPHTLRAVTLLAVSLRKAGHHVRAAELTGPARKTLLARYGERHPDYLAASLNLSIDMRQLGDLNESRRLGEITRDLYRQVLGPQHPHTNSAEMDLAITYRLLNRVDLAKGLNESALEHCLERLGDRHPDVLVARTNLASDLFAQGDVSAALGMDEKTLELAVSILGASHPTVLVIKSNLAQDLRASGRTEEAEAMHQEAAEELESCLSRQHPAWQDATQWRRANCDIDPMPI
ncbi:FxSxx-COOH system tetratricopeptide repeat protein [Streptomyces sp. T028]|uniref:FxSxx-COOH system tetratricopeptide repeat protein n=1 Tax=Streptomyces sp. T028 TaxID=3394379 RepID=UPI003A89FCE6